MRVSCLTVTLPVPERLPMLARALAAYAAQDWAKRELVVVVDHGPARAEAAALAGRYGARVIVPEGRHALGALRNLAVAAAAGELLCQWDDDDLHHRTRIAAQVAALQASGKAAVLLGEVLMFREADRTLRWTNWARTPTGGHPATLLWRREAGLRYPDEAASGEDLAAVMPLVEAGAVERLTGKAALYIYVSHAANVSGAAHHAMLAETLGVSAGLLRRREAAVRAALAGVDFGPGAVTVEGANGTAFVL